MATPKLGIIGAGAVAQQHAQAYASVGTTISAICDIDLDRATKLAGTCDDARAVTDADDLFAMDDVDAVVVAVPNFLHRDLAVRGLAAGKDVLLEKPMALNVAECDTIVDAVNGSDRILQMGFVTRQSPAALAAKRFIDEGRLGRIYHVRVSLCRRRGIPGMGRWFTTKTKSGGGVLLDLGVHLIDLAMHLTGRRSVSRVSGVCSNVFGQRPDDYTFTEMWAGPPEKNGTFDVEDTAMGMVWLGDDLTLEINTTWAMNLPEGQMPHGVFVLGDKGGLYANVWSNEMVLSTEQDGYLVDTRPVIPGEDAWGDAWRNQCRLFTGLVADRKAATATAEEGRAVQVVLDALYESSRNKREIVM